MTPKITFKKIWSDEDCSEYRITVCDGISEVRIDVYVGYNYIDELILNLENFKNQIYGGVYDILMSKFGYEYGGGAFQARLHYFEKNKLCISTIQQSDFTAFAGRKVASESKLYLYTEPVLLDNFITQLNQLASGTIDNVELECIPIN